MPSRTAVVYLFREGTAETELLRFFDSYDKKAAGAEHLLTVVWKGFDLVPEHLQDRARASNASFLTLPDDGYDLTAYRRAATMVEGDVLCFLNSHSEVLSDRWLSILTAPLWAGHAGLSGATASAESHFSSLLKSATKGARPSLSQLPGSLAAAFRIRRAFPAFPNPHIRTNAFAIRRGDLETIRFPRIRTKLDAEAMESGRQGITAQLLARGRKVVVTGSNGQTFEQADFHRSHSFRTGSQCNLLVADNRTRGYLLGSSSERAALAELAWGDSALAGPQCPQCGGE